MNQGIYFIILEEAEFRKCYDHPLSLTKSKKSNDQTKETHLISINNFNNSNLTNNGVSLLATNKVIVVTNETKNTFLAEKSVRSNSQTNLKNVSRNNSIRESNNNSLNKDSLKTSEKLENNVGASNVTGTNILSSVPINPNTKILRTQFPSHIGDFHKEIVNNQELLTKNEKNGAFSHSTRKNITNNLNKNNYIMDNNLENECGKNDYSFKVYETNKINYPLKIEQNNNFSTNSGGYFNNYLMNHNPEKNDSDNSLINQKGKRSFYV